MKMSKENLEVISVLGPLGAGKTTTLNRLIEQVPVDESYAVVVNDVGENNIDAQRIWDHPANRSDRIIPLTAGCIGCSDVTQFREALERVHDAGVNVLFIEPTGIAPGTEIADVVRSSGFDLSVLTLTNAQTIARDLKWQVLPSQLAVADIIGVTHIPDEKDEATVVATVLEQLPPLPEDVSVELIKPGTTNYFEILAKLRGVERQLRLGRQLLPLVCDCGDLHQHDHNHAHTESGGHGVSAKSLRIKQGIDVTDVADLLLPYVHHPTNPLLRAKGVANGIRFDLVGDEWSTEVDTVERDPIMNVIFGGGIPEGFTAATTEMTIPVERAKMIGDKKTIVKSVSDMPISERVAIVSERIRQYPAPISPLHGELIPDCEADEGYEIAFWGNNDDMPEESKRQAMDAYITFRLAGLHELLYHADHITNFEQKQSYWRRRYGATLGYNVYHLGEYMTREQRDVIKQHNPANMLAEGFLALDRLAFDEGRAEEKPEFISSVLIKALEKGDITEELAQKVKTHGMSLANGDLAWLDRWDKLKL